MIISSYIISSYRLKEVSLLQNQVLQHVYFIIQSYNIYHRYEILMHARINAFSTKYSQIFNARGVPRRDKLYNPDIIIHFCSVIETQYMTHKNVVTIFYLQRVPATCTVAWYSRGPNNWPLKKTCSTRCVKHICIWLFNINRLFNLFSNLEKQEEEESDNELSKLTKRKDKSTDFIYY